MSVPGTGAYAALNALAAFVAGFEILRRARAERSAATDRLVRSLAESLATHEGVARRMQMIGATEHVAVYDDYAHHPTAARLATAAIKERHAGAFLAVAFQPHTRSRTEAMFDAFADALGGEGGVDALVVTPVFDARPERQGQIRGSEDEASGAEASDLAARLAARRRRVCGDRGGSSTPSSTRFATRRRAQRRGRHAKTTFMERSRSWCFVSARGPGSTSRAGFSRGSTSGIRDRRVGARPSRVARRHVTTPTKRRVRGHAMRASRM